jgi:SAM-dependent MidA family methyltransferase
VTDCGIDASASLIDVVRARGPVTVAAFMDLALYDPRFGYYARAARRSGRAGDFFTSVDVSAIFGELLEIQIAEMAALLSNAPSPAPFDLVEAGAGDGRLAADILRAAERRDPDVLARLRLHLVEVSPEARAAQRETLGPLAGRLVSSLPELPGRFEGLLLANELLDALPVHQVVARAGELREVYVAADGDRLTALEGPLSTPALAAYLADLGIALDEGWRVEINLRARDWIADAAHRLRRGFIVLIDYGHPAGELYSATHAGGTLTTFSRHTMGGPEASAATPAWLLRPGEQDITAHVDFTTIQRTAEAAGLVTLGFLDQTYFLMGLMDTADLAAGLAPAQEMKQRMALKTLLMPGGLGSTFKVLILGKDVGAPRLKGCSFRVRVT